jgi:hypothetical protein
MYGIFMECWVALKLYGGNGVLLLMFIAASIYIIAAEKDIKKKIILGILPLVILAGFLLPVTKIVYVAVFDDGSDTYYRLLWIIPMYAVIAYGACKALIRMKRASVRRGSFALMLVIIAVTGSFVYGNQYMSVAENLYHIPQNVIDICDVISPAEGQPRVRAAFPSELVHFVRQYDTDILMPYGREMVVTQWDYYNAVYEVMEKPETIDVDALLEATRQTKCHYIVLSDSRKINGSLLDYGLNAIANIDGYTIFEDPQVQ